MTQVFSTPLTTPTSPPPSMGSDLEPPTLQVVGTLWGLIKTPLSGVRPPHGTPVLWPTLPHRCERRMTVWGGYQVPFLTPALHCSMQEAPPCLGRGRAHGMAPTLPHLLNFLTTPRWEQCGTFDFTGFPPRQRQRQPRPCGRLYSVHSNRWHRHLVWGRHSPASR